MPTATPLDRALRRPLESAEHPAVRVVDQDDLLRPEQPLGYRERSDRVVRDDAAGVADHVRVALL
jgi:hypothetical protein